MLSRRDRERLAELEHHLSREDPKLARLLAGDRRPARTRTAWALVVLGAAGVLAGLISSSLPVLVVLGVLPLLLWLSLRRRWSTDRTRHSWPPPGRRWE
jgi:hypothetical protein